MKFYVAKVLLMLISIVLFGQETRIGSIEGHVKDIHTSQPLIAANIQVLGKTAGAATDLDGNFTIPNLPVGNYKIQISIVGYKTIIKNKVLVKANRPTMLNVNLSEDVSSTDVIVVRPTYFAKSKDAVVSNRNMDIQEIEMQPGGCYDIQRSIQAFPAVVSGADQQNEIIVRGGNFGENLFIMDNIEIPNPNHFSKQGGSGGPISIIYNDFVSEVDFFAGAFPARYGDKTSSVLDVTLREGLRDKFHFKFDLNMSGVGGNVEGPIGQKGSYMVSAHKSYMEFLAGAWQMTAVPEYWNTQSKVVYDFTPRLKLSSFLLYAQDDITIKSTEEDSFDPGDNWKYIGKTGQYVIGGTLKKIMNKGFAGLTLSSVSHKWDEEVGDTLGEDHFSHNQTIEMEHTIKTDIVYSPIRSTEISAGVYYKYGDLDYDYFENSDTLYIYEPGTDSIIGNTGQIYGYEYEQKFNTSKYGAYLQYSQNFGALLKTNIGLRYDALDYTKNSYISPRLSASYRILAETSINVAYGRHYQPPEFYMLAFNGSGTTLDHFYTDQYVLGIEHFFAEDIRATVEGYYKKYEDYPFETSELTNDPHDEEYSYVNAVGGEARGVELFLQKKVKNNFWGTLSYSLSEATEQDPRQDSLGEYLYGEYPKSFDFGHVATFIVGYQKEFMHKAWYKESSKKWWWWSFGWMPGMPSDESGYSIRFRYLGGRPYSEPIYDSSLRTWYVPEGTEYNQERMPAYTRLDLHIKSRWYFGKTTVYTYLEIDNILGTENIWTYQRYEDGEKDKILQLGTMVVGGFLIEF